MKEAPRKQVERRLRALDTDFDTFKPDLVEIAEYIAPRRGRFQVEDANNGKRRERKIIRIAAPKALRVAGAGLMAGHTSPARPWFQLGTPDPDLMEFEPVKAWLHLVTSRMRWIFARSNFYQAIHSVYLDLAAFGTAACAIEEDPDDIIRLYPQAMGSYRLGQNDRHIIDTFYARRRKTVAQLVDRYGLDACSPEVQAHYTNGNYDLWIDVVHVVQPNRGADYGRNDNRNYPIKSCWYEVGRNGDRFLYEGGFLEFPILAPRWDVLGEDTYGTGPGHLVLGHAKAIQLQERRKAQLIDKFAEPPMAAPASMRNQRSSLLPGDVNYYDTLQGGVKFEPVYVPDPRGYQFLREDIAETHEQIREAFYEDLFLMMAGDERRQPATAEEIVERRGEKMLMLGPVGERLNTELFDRAIDRTFMLMLRRGLVPPPPEELQQTQLKVEYISVLAQAQQMVGINAIERLIGYVGMLAQSTGDLGVWDKVDKDQTIDEYSNMLGVPPKLVLPDDRVAEIRDGRARMQAMQSMAAAAQPAAQAAKALKDLSQAQMGDQNALEVVSGVNG